jgi:hypothetical protein
MLNIRKLKICVLKYAQADRPFFTLLNKVKLLVKWIIQHRLLNLN